MEPDKPQDIDYNALLIALETKRDDLDKAIAGVKALLGLPAASGNGTPAPEAPKSLQALDDHAFFGMSISAAAHKYLSVKKKPATALEMAGALIDGGFASQSDNFGSTITTALYRNPDTFVKVKRGLWALKAWYPNYRPDKDTKGK